MTSHSAQFGTVVLVNINPSYYCIYMYLQRRLSTEHFTGYLQDMTLVIYTTLHQLSNEHDTGYLPNMTPVIYRKLHRKIDVMYYR